MTEEPSAPQEPPQADVRPSRRFALVWLVPIVTVAIALYLGWETLATRGPLVTVAFTDGTGLTAGQTRVEHKSVPLGTVERVTLSSDYRDVIARIRMSRAASGMLTDHARFWVVRPRVSVTDVSGLQTLVSGSYIAIDPGQPGGRAARHFRGLERPPGVRSDQPGRTFTLRAPRLGWLEAGAPVFYRDVAVGQLLDYQVPGMGQPIVMHVFIRAPFDQYVRSATHFWNTSGLSTTFGPSGVHVAVESIQALLAGGIEFANFADAENAPPAPLDTTFRLYENFDAAQNAGFRDNIKYVAYFTQSVSGLQPGSAVQLFGIRVGTVTATELQLDPHTEQPRVRVAFDVQPARVFAPGNIPRGDPLDATRKLVALGMRARVDTGNLLTGQDVIGLDMVPHAPDAAATTEGDRIVWPSAGGGWHDLTNSLGEVVAKLDALPLDKLGGDASDLVGSLHALVTTANSELKPVATQLPALSQQMQITLKRADRVLASIEAGYGADSTTQQTLKQLAVETTEAMRSVRELAGYLQRHPGALVWGR
jgi:paraquat-inducible protein B